MCMLFGPSGKFRFATNAIIRYALVHISPLDRSVPSENVGNPLSLPYLYPSTLGERTFHNLTCIFSLLPLRYCNLIGNSPTQRNSALSHSTVSAVNPLFGFILECTMSTHICQWA